MPTRAALPLVAEGGHHHGHDLPRAEPADTAATKALRAADAEMHRDMAIAYANDVDLDVVRGMIPHHRGTEAMARVALAHSRDPLAHSRDPEIRRLAQEIIAAQDVEIARMEAFLKRRESAAER